MAPKRKRKSKRPDLNDRTTPLRWEDDLTGKERAGAQREISRIGKQTKSGTAEAVAKLRAAGEEGNSDYSRMAGHKADRVEAAGRAFKNKPITLSGATQRRQEVWQRAIDYARNTGKSLPGAGWYVGHSEEINAARGDIPWRRAAAASAALSPGKDPKADEIPAFTELARIHNEPHDVTVKGKTTRASQMKPEHLANIATKAAGGDKTIESTSKTFPHAGKAHEAMTARSIQAIRGDVSAETVNNPLSGPKTSSYFWSIAHAGEMTNEERIDYESIARHAVNGNPDQGMLMFSQTAPGGPSRESLLSPEHDTAEDTWMQAITSGQDLSAVNPDTGRKFSPAKRAVDKGAPGEMAQFLKREAGIRDDPNVTKQGVVHAFNNKATRDAAANVGPISFNQFGEHIQIPSVMMQEVAWTQARREAGGDAPFNKQQREAEKAAAKAAKSDARAAKAEEKRKSKEEPRLPGF